MIKAFWFRQEREWENHAWSAWHTAAFQRSKKMPEFKKMMGKQDKATTEDQMAAILGSIKNG